MTREVIHYGPASLEPPTPAQIRAISKFCTILRISYPLEERLGTKQEASSLYRQLESQVRLKRKLEK